MSSSSAESPSSTLHPETRFRRRNAAWRWSRLGLILGLPGLLGIVVANGPAGAQPQAPVESYVVIMAAEPAVAYEGDQPGLAATAPDTGDKIEPAAPEVEAYVEHLEAVQDEVAAAAGVKAQDVGESYTYALNGFEADLTAQEVVELERQPEVAKVVVNELRQLQTDASPKFLGLNARRGAWASGLVGEDVVVGVIDSGIWPEHPSFADDGSYPALADYAGLPCEFGDTAHNPDDAAFACNNKFLGARDMRDSYKSVLGAERFNSARDYDGHGTHTASTAAGNADVSATMLGIDRGTVSGIAPRARVIAYSACGDQGCFTADLVGAIDAAVADGVDVINYSIGGGASLTAPDDIAFLFAADANVWVATSAGNDGPGPGTIGSPAGAPWITTVGASTTDRTFTNTIRLGNGQIATGVSITGGTRSAQALVDAADLGNELCDPAVPFTGVVTGKVVLCLRGVVARVDKSVAVADAGGAGMILYNPNDAQALVTDSHVIPSTHVNFTTGSAVKAYIAAAGSAAKATLTAGRAAPTQGSVMADFSSRGENPVAPDVIKPDVTAPGVNILAGQTPFTNSGAPGQLFQSISGTSMSSPHVAGLFALMRQAHPEWTAAMAKSAIMTTARQDVTKEDGVTPADPFDMGAGHIDPSGRPTAKGSVFSPGLVYDAGLVDYFAFLCGVDTSVFLDPASTCGQFESAGVSTETTDLNLASIGASSIAGSVTVQRTVTSVADSRQTFRADVQAPPGFDVVVTPNEVELPPGESADVEITITNATAPVDTWAFGSLTWTGGGYEVRSPIAVRAALFDAPASVSGTGVDGSVEFPIQFGFAGAYTAAPHGPVASTPVAGTADQDPDQAFDPNDPTGTTAIPLTTAGAAFLRLRLAAQDLAVADPDVDLDIYLYDSAGNEVASSAAGGTNELIELVLPPDDTWTLYVHGWQTAGGPVDFELQTWAVPATPSTGALVIDDAPSTAAIGAVGTITASWAGLDPAAEYVGAVSHSSASGLIGLTLVDIMT